MLKGICIILHYCVQMLPTQEILSKSKASNAVWLCIWYCLWRSVSLEENMGAVEEEEETGVIAVITLSALA